MQAVNDKFQKSCRAVSRQSEQLVGSTIDAGRSFVTDTRRAGQKFALFAGKETKSWASYLSERKVAAAVNSRERLSRPGFQRGLLLRLAVALEALQGQVRDRLDALDAGAELPLDDYDAMTAKAIVAQLGELSDAQCRAIYTLEQGRKQRTTVLRALEQRLAA